MEIVDNIDKNFKCDREKIRKIQSLQSKIHKALKSGSMESSLLLVLVLNLVKKLTVLSYLKQTAKS